MLLTWEVQNVPLHLINEPLCRAVVRGGATGAIAPGIFEKVGLSPMKNLGVKFQKRKELSNLTGKNI